jgi:hypothetical protein
MSRTVFYAWQSDTDAGVNHHFIAEALKKAIARLNIDLQLLESESELSFDRDTHGEPGMPPVADTILRKIDGAAVFVADLTFVASVGPRHKGLPNANVDIELGYAARALTFERIVCVFNEHFGSPEHLPFDLVHRRFPVRYTLSPDATPQEREAAAAALADALVAPLRDTVTKARLTPKEDPFAHAAAPLESCSFIASGDGSIARTKARDDEGRESEHVYWHHSPSAWLRLIPARSKNFGRTELRRLVEGATIPLRAFGGDVRQQLESNDYGVVALGFDGDELPHIAMQLTQVFRSGEIWGLNRSLIEPIRIKPHRTFQIPWPALQQQFQQTLARYIDFARQVLELPLPVTLVAGLAMIRDAVFIGEKAQWLTDPPRRTRCFQEFIRHQATIHEWGEPQPTLLEPLFKTTLDECDQDYA